MDEPRVGIASLQRFPPELERWLRYHIEVGVSAFYLRFEDDHDGAYARAAKHAVDTYGNKRVILRVDPHTKTKHTSNNYVDVNTRQTAWVNAAMALAKQDGIEWLVHIDDDELLHARVHGGHWPAVLRDLPHKCHTLHITNWEGFSPAQQTSSWITDPGVHYMPRKCAHHFAVYANGKSAARVSADPMPTAHGVHRFQSAQGASVACDVPEDTGVVLHHDSLPVTPGDLPPRSWVEKHRLRIGSDYSRIPFEATRKAIDAVASGSAQAMEEVWRTYRCMSGKQYKKCAVPRQVTLPSHSW